MKTVGKLLAIAIPFIWCGMIGGISFLEAPLKFTAPGVTLSVGLSIGSLVFYVFNKVELLLMAIWLFALIIQRFPLSKYLLIILITILLWQSFWLLPSLETRASLIRAGLPTPGQSVHIWYVCCETSKFLLLTIAGFSLSKSFLL
jgi:hypothetical protein